MYFLEQESKMNIMKSKKILTINLLPYPFDLKLTVPDV